jgi:hypothetical protein
MWLATGLLVLGLGACAIKGQQTLPMSGEGGNDGTGNTGQGAGNGSGGLELNGGNDSTGAGNDDCGTLNFTAEPIGVEAFIAVDKSGSMGDLNKWANTKAAFTAFFTDPQADSLSVALRFWPDLTCGMLCSPSFCATPEVPMGSLADPNHEQALIGTFNLNGPYGATPMDAALGGACQYAVDNQAGGEAGKRLVVIFLTDGEPTECNLDINAIAGHAAAAFNNHDVLTFAVGLQGSNEAQMNTIAQAGGTNAAYFIGSNNAQAELIAALKAIQEVAVACSFAMPESPDPSKAVDPTKVTVIYKTHPADPGMVIPQVANEGSCDPNTGGWYYDNPADPAAILLCEASCNQANNVNFPEGSIEVEAGCKIIAD